jgi:hypothetical protein
MINRQQKINAKISPDPTPAVHILHICVIQAKLCKCAGLPPVLAVSKFTQIAPSDAYSC